MSHHGADCLKRTSQRFTEVDRYIAHAGKILATAVFTSGDRALLATGGNDNTIAFWDISTATSTITRLVLHSNGRRKTLRFDDLG